MNGTNVILNPDGTITMPADILPSATATPLGIVYDADGSVTSALLGAGAGGIRIIRVGLPDRYVAHGKPALLHEEVGFTGQRIAERVAAAIADSGDPAHGAGSAIIGA